MSSNCRPDSIKVVIIKTQYVQTDPTSFKSVVQKLTGKDSKVPDSPDSTDYCTGSRTGGSKGTWPSGSGSKVDGPTLMMRNLSFKELDWLMKEVSNMENLDYLCTQ